MEGEGGSYWDYTRGGLSSPPLTLMKFISVRCRVSSASISPYAMMEVTFSRVSRSTSRICMQGGEGHDAQTPGSGPGGRDACSLGGCMQGGGGRITIHVAGGDGKEWMSRREPCLSQWG